MQGKFKNKMPEKRYLHGMCMDKHTNISKDGHTIMQICSCNVAPINHTFINKKSRVYRGLTLFFIILPQSTD